MRVPFPRSPYSNIRDDRSRRTMTRERLIQVVDRAEECRSKIADLIGQACMADALQRLLPPKAFWTADDVLFDVNGGSMSGVQAFCDFADGTMMVLRERIWVNLFNDYETALRQDSRETIAHEFGHVLLKSHKRKLAARAKNSGFSTDKRAAFDQNENWNGSFETSKARNLDLEEEANCFAFALLEPVKTLDGKLTINEVGGLYDVSTRVAYEAALLAKDYHRATFIRNARR